MEHVLHVLVSYCVTVLSMLQLLYIYPGLGVKQSRGYAHIYMGYIGMYRPIGYGFEGLDKNRLTLFDLVSVVYPV